MADRVRVDAHIDQELLRDLGIIHLERSREQRAIDFHLDRPRREVRSDMGIHDRNEDPERVLFGSEKEELTDDVRKTCRGIMLATIRRAINETNRTWGILDIRNHIQVRL